MNWSKHVDNENVDSLVDTVMKEDKKTRLDLLLVERGLFPTREASKRAVMAGLVRSQGQVLDKPGTLVRQNIDVTILKPDHQFVSRGGLKLEHALSAFGCSVEGRVVLDVGASTGGFTDCVLKRNARYVHAVDVGYGQFAWALRNDERVHLVERTNFRHVDPAIFVPKPDFAVMDVSFISIRLLLPKLVESLSDKSDIVTLVKPQFEAGKESVGKGGIVRDPATHYRVLREVVQSAASSKLECKDVTFSPIAGGDGNIEFFLWLCNSGDAPNAADLTFKLEETVRLAWSTLKDQEVSF